jgi:uncharacterized protein
MIIKVRVKPSASQSELKEEGDGYYQASLKSKPENNDANKELIGIVAKRFGIDWRKVKIKSGIASRHKIVEVNF